jgi:hypothetical protein
MSRQVVLGVSSADTSDVASSLATALPVVLSWPDSHVSFVPCPSFTPSPALSLMQPPARIGIAVSSSYPAQS